MREYYYSIKKFLVRKYYDFKIVNWRDLIFIEPKVTLIFLFIFLLNIVTNIHEIGLPNKFPSLENCISTIEILIRSVVVLLSIIFSFTLLSFQIFNKYFGRFAFYDFFKKSHLKIMFTFFIINVAFLIYTFNYLQSCRADNYFRGYGKLLFIESIIFTIVLTVSIFPVMINLLSHSQSRNNIKSIFKSIKDDTISSSQLIFNEEIDEDQYLTDAFKILTEISLVAIKDFDHPTLGITLRNIYFKFSEVSKSIKKEKLKRQLYYKFRDILKDLFGFAVKEKNNFAMSGILATRLKIEKETIAGGFVLDFEKAYRGWDFDNDIEDFYNKTIQNNEDSISGEIVDLYRDFFLEIVKYKFPTTFQYDFDNPYVSITESSIVSTNYEILNTLIKRAGKSKKISVCKNLCNFFKTLDIEIIESSNSDDVKRFLLSVNNRYKEKFLIALIEDFNIQNIEILYYPFGIGNTIEVKRLGSSIILKSQLKFIDSLFYEGMLNNFVLNDLKAMALSLIDHYEDDKVEVERSLRLIIEKFDSIRNLIKENDSNDRKDIYIKLKTFFGYITSIYSIKVNNDDLKNMLEVVNSNFEYFGKFTSDLDEVGYLQNNIFF